MRISRFFSVLLVFHPNSQFVLTRLYIRCLRRSALVCVEEFQVLLEALLIKVAAGEWNEELALESFTSFADVASSEKHLIECLQGFKGAPRKPG